jgi:hypothetical protein
MKNQMKVIKHYYDDKGNLISNVPKSFYGINHNYLHCEENKIRSLKNCKVEAIWCGENRIKDVKHALIGIYSYRSFNKIKDNSYLDLVYERGNKYLMHCRITFRNKNQYRKN